MSDELIATFISGRTLDEQVSALNGLIAARQLSRATKTPDFTKGVEKLIEYVGDPDYPSQRMIALAAICRIASIVKRSRAHLSDALATALSNPLPPLQSVSDPDNRLYIVSAWRYSQGAWWKSYLSITAVEEDSAERVRQKSLEGLIALSPNLSAVISELHEPLSSLRFRTEKPNDSMARRVRRLASALRIAFSKSGVEPGFDAGAKLANLLKSAFRLTGAPTHHRTAVELAEEVGKLVHEIVRARFSLATSPTTYAAVHEVHSWFEPSDWEGFTQESKSYALLSRDVREALNLLVRAGVSDNELFSTLTVAIGSLDRARVIGRELADELKGLPEHLRNWLLGKAPRTRSSLATESQERTLDEVIGELLIDAARFSELSQALRRDTLPEIAVVAPQIADSVGAFIILCESMTNTVRLLANRRHLQIRGTNGQELEFSPLEHEMVGGPQAGVRRVRLISPIVEAAASDGTLRIVRKGLVEPVDSNQ